VHVYRWLTSIQVYSFSFHPLKRLFYRANGFHLVLKTWKAFLPFYLNFWNVMVLHLIHYPISFFFFKYEIWQNIPLLPRISNYYDIICWKIIFSLNVFSLVQKSVGHISTGPVFKFSNLFYLSRCLSSPILYS
jgi:hypothetical protein